MAALLAFEVPCQLQNDSGGVCFVASCHHEGRHDVFPAVSLRVCQVTDFITSHHNKGDSNSLTLEQESTMKPTRFLLTELDLNTEMITQWQIEND